MKLKVTSGGVPPGSYVAKFLGIEAFSDDRYGGGLRWQFEVSTGVCKGLRVSRVTGTNPTPKNSCGKILGGLLGKTLNGGEEVDLATEVGKRFLIVVAQTESGASKVDAVTLPPVE